MTFYPIALWPMLFFGWSNIGSKTAFTIGKSDKIICWKHLHTNWESPSSDIPSKYYDFSWLPRRVFLTQLSRISPGHLIHYSRHPTKSFDEWTSCWPPAVVVQYFYYIAGCLLPQALYPHPYGWGLLIFFGYARLLWAAEGGILTH